MRTRLSSEIMCNINSRGNLRAISLPSPTKPSDTKEQNRLQVILLVLSTLLTHQKQPHSAAHHTSHDPTTNTNVYTAVQYSPLLSSKPRFSSLLLLLLLLLLLIMSMAAICNSTKHNGGTTSKLSLFYGYNFIFLAT